MSFIVDRLYLGNIKDAANHDFMIQNNIEVIVNCTKDIPNYFEHSTNIKYFRVPIEDNLKECEMANFNYHARQLLPLLYDDYMSGKTLFIHCFAGMQRSAALVLLFIIYLNKRNHNKCMSVSDAQFFVLSKRPLAFNYGMHMNFEEPVNIIAHDICNNS
jgi:protein-tyrosine phosphatase